MYPAFVLCSINSKKLLVKMDRTTYESAMVFFWYLVAGGIATAVHYALLLVLVEAFAFPAPLSASAGALTGAMVSYFINRHVTFPGATRRHHQALPRFLLIALLGALLNGGLVWVGVHALAWHYLAAQALATVLVLGLTFRLNRSWTFA